MLDSYVRAIIDPALDALGEKFAALGFSANNMTMVGLVFGILAMIAIISREYSLALLLICCNRLADGLDGAIARQIKLTDFGGFLDIVCDFIVYAGIVFAFGMANPASMAYAGFLIFSFIGPIATFLAYAIIASKQQINTDKRGKKSFYYLGGICEGTETAVVLVLCCIIPHNFNALCIIFGILCWLTTFGRIYNSWVDFGESYTPLTSFAGAYTRQAEEIKSQGQ